MSLPVFSTQGELFSTAGLSGALFADTDRYRLFAKLVYPALVSMRPELESCYCLDNGRQAVEPLLLMGVSLLQYLDGLPDRQAVDMLHYHAGWNFALNRNVGDELFHPTTLVNFRQRLIQHQKSTLGFEAVLDGLVAAGLVARQSRQRLDSTQIFGQLSRMSRLECVRETLRLALEELAQSTAAEVKPAFWPQLWERYVESKLDYRAGTAALCQKMNLAGSDAAQLLDWVRQLSDRAPGNGEQVKLLGRVWQEQFVLDEAGSMVSGPSQPPGAVVNPHEPEAQWAAKGRGKDRKEHVGYKIQVAETVAGEPVKPGEPTPNFITAMVTQPAIESDKAGLAQVEQEQAQMGLETPSQWYVDGAYVSAEKLAQAQSEGRDIVGPAQLPPKMPGRFTIDDFDICVEMGTAICPGGHRNTECSRIHNGATSLVDYRFEFGRHCHDCPLRGQCLGKDQKHRRIEVTQFHTVLQARRREQRTQEFERRTHLRNAIEGTQSELVRAHGLRRARYRGLRKVRLQNYFCGAACNIKRWIRRQAWLLTQGVSATAMTPAQKAAN